MYQTATASRVSITASDREERLLAAWISSVNPMTEAIEVPLSMLMKSLPVGGMITLIAWGSTTRPSTSRGDIPIDFRRLGLSAVDAGQPGPDDLCHVGALVQPEPQQGRGEGGHEGVRGLVQQVRPGERDGDDEPGEDERDVVPEQDLQQHRQPTKDPDVGPGHPPGHGVRRGAHQGDDHPDDDGTALGEHGQDEGVAQPGEDDGFVEQRGDMSP